MRLGQISSIFFLSRLGTSALGFVATLYIARLLGAEPLGIYNLALGVASWMAVVGNVGVSSAVAKRVSEGEDKEEYALAGSILLGVLFLLLVIGIFAFRSYVDQYVGYPAAGILVLILFVTLSFSIVGSLLSGLHLVHIRGVLSTVRTGIMSLLQIGALVAGFRIAGLFFGYIAGYLFVLLVGVVITTRRLRRPRWPRKHHFKSLVDYGKFAWLGSLQSRMFNYTDVIVLGFFVPSVLIGVYSVAWSIGQFLLLFSGSLKSTLFPEMSKISADRDPQVVAEIVEQALTYAGLFLIPGLIGGLLLGERLLILYGDEFPQGAIVLVILILANLFMGYQNQLLNSLNAINRPDISFRVNVAFVLVNLVFNVILIYRYGWIGAAVATTLSVAVSLVLAYVHLSRIIDFELPYVEIVRQWVAALLMGSIVYGGLWIENTHLQLRNNFVTVLVLVGLGAGTYFLILLVISPTFRDTVDRNVPVQMPGLAR